MEDVNNSDSRLKKDIGAGRRSRGFEDREVTERRDISDDDRLEMFRAQMYRDALPSLPDIPGYHVCWLTTTNKSDSIQQRMMLGYEPIRGEDIPGMDLVTVKTGEYAGLIGVNEMLAFKLPDSLYQRYMIEAHYDAPNREEERLADTAEYLKEQAARTGGRLIEEEGMADMHDNYIPRRSRFD